MFQNFTHSFINSLFCFKLPLSSVCYFVFYWLFSLPLLLCAFVSLIICLLLRFRFIYVYFFQFFLLCLSLLILLLLLPTFLLCTPPTFHSSSSCVPRLLYLKFCHFPFLFTSFSRRSSLPFFASSFYKFSPFCVISLLFTSMITE